MENHTDSYFQSCQLHKKPTLLVTHRIYGIWMFPKIGVPQNGWFIMENPIKMGWFGGTPIFGNIHIYLHLQWKSIKCRYTWISLDFELVGISVKCAWIDDKREMVLKAAKKEDPHAISMAEFEQWELPGSRWALTSCIPSLKLTFSHLKMDGWNTSFLLGLPIFRGYVIVSGSVWTEKGSL